MSNISLIGAGSYRPDSVFRLSGNDAGTPSSFRDALADAAEHGRAGFAAGAGARAPAEPSAVEREFMEYAAMSPQEKLFFALLASLGISKEEYEAMSPEDRQALSQKVQIAMREALQQDREGNATV